MSASALLPGSELLREEDDGRPRSPGENSRCQAHPPSFDPVNHRRHRSPVIIFVTLITGIVARLAAATAEVHPHVEWWVRCGQTRNAASERALRADRKREAGQGPHRRLVGI